MGWILASHECDVILTFAQPRPLGAEAEIDEEVERRVGHRQQLVDGDQVAHPLKEREVKPFLK